MVLLLEAKEAVQRLFDAAALGGRGGGGTEDVESPSHSIERSRLPSLARHSPMLVGEAVSTRCLLADDANTAPLDAATSFLEDDANASTEDTFSTGELVAEDPKKPNLLTDGNLAKRSIDDFALSLLLLLPIKLLLLLSDLELLLLRLLNWSPEDCRKLLRMLVLT